MDEQVCKRDKLDYIVILRNIALLLVLFAHSSAVYTGAWDFKIVNDTSKGIKYTTSYFQTIRMPLFVFISGFLYYYNRIKLNRYNSYPIFLMNKARRLLIPYLIAGIFFMIPIQMLFNVYKDNETFLYRIINEILFAKEPGHLWFLLALFNIFIVFYAFENLINRNSIIFNSIFLSLIGVVSLKLPNIYQVRSSLIYFVYFYMGYVFCKYIKIIRGYSANKKYIFLIHFILFNIQYFIINNVENTTLYFKLFRFLFKEITSIIGVTFMFMYVLEFSSNKYIVDKIRKNNIFKLLNENKFYIYLLHQPIMKAILVKIRGVNIKPFILVSLLFWLTLIISFILSVFIKEIKKNLIKFIERVNYAK